MCVGKIYRACMRSLLNKLLTWPDQYFMLQFSPFKSYINYKCKANVYDFIKIKMALIFDFNDT